MSGELWALVSGLVVLLAVGAIPRPAVEKAEREAVGDLVMDGEFTELPLVEVPGWPDASLKLGQVSGVATDKNGDVLVFHRGDRVWGSRSFTETNKFAEAEKGPIKTNTILRLDPTTGKVKNELGSGLFYLPHGLTVDSKGNLWLTDVGLHQVMRIPAGSKTADLTLGTKFEPGSDDTHFCKPTDVAVASNGEFFVADGYCNSRILKYSNNGTLLKEWGTLSAGFGAVRRLFNVPHSLALLEKYDAICVADRENARVPCFSAGLIDPSITGTEMQNLVADNEIGRVYGIEYDPNDDVVHAVVSPSENPLRARGFTFGLSPQGGVLISEWGNVPQDVDSLPHDVTVSPDGRDVYLAEIGKISKKVVKFSVDEQPE